MFEDSGEIYIINNTINNKQYIGQSVCYLSNGKQWGSKKRWIKHISQATTNKCECRLLENAIRKYGETVFTLNVIVECGVHELNVLEEQYIQKYNTLAPNGYNLMTGGGNGRRHSDETRKKMTMSRIGKKHLTITKEKIGEKHKGKIVSEKTKEKIGESSRYRNIDIKHKEKIEQVLKENKLETLPIYINYITDIQRQSDGFIVRIPNYPYKKFISKSLTLTKKLALAQIYKQNISNQRLSV